MHYEKHLAQVQWKFVQTLYYYVFSLPKTESLTPKGIIILSHFIFFPSMCTVSLLYTGKVSDLAVPGGTRTDPNVGTGFHDHKA